MAWESIQAQLSLNNCLELVWSEVASTPNKSYQKKFRSLFSFIFVFFSWEMLVLPRRDNISAFLLETYLKFDATGQNQFIRLIEIAGPL